MERLATAEWADATEVAQNRAFRDGQFWLGRSPADGSMLGYTDDRHIVLVSGNRAGKGTTTVIPNLCLWPGSVFVLDPKGENATVTAARRGAGSAYCEGMGQRVHVLDPFGASHVDDRYRSRFNPLDALDPESPTVIDDADLIADALIVVSERASDPDWQETAKKMLKGLVLHVLTHAMFEGRRDLLTVRELIRHGDQAGAELLRTEGSDDVPSARQLLWEGLARNTALGGIIAGIGDHMADLLIKAPKQFEGYHAPLDLNTKFLDSPKMQGVLGGSDFDLADLKTDPKGVSVYLCLPQRYMTTHARWLRLMVALTTARMEEIAEQPASGHRVLMVLDEFARLETMPTIEHAVSYIAGYGVTMLFVLQSLEQLKKHYGGSWETFLGCAGTKLFFSIDDQFTREYVAKLVGDTELVRTVRTSSTTMTESSSVTHGRSTSITDGTSHSESESENQSRTEGTGESSTRGTSQNASRSGGVTSSTGTNFSRSMGMSQTAGWNQSSSNSTNQSRSAGTSDTWSLNSGWSMGDTSTRQSGTGHTSSSGRSGSSGQTDSQSTGQNQSYSSSENQSFGRSSSHSRAQSRNRSTTAGTGSSTSRGTTRSVTDATSESRTTGTSHSTTEGESGSVHKRPLITPEEIGYVFDRPESGGVGLALVIIGGGRPAAVFRSPYYMDLHFAWLFDPHPDHPKPLERIGVEEFCLGFDLHASMLEGSFLRSLVDTGREVARGGPIVGLNMLLPAGEDRQRVIDIADESDVDALDPFDTDRVTVPVLSPVSGTVIEEITGRITPDAEQQKLATIRVDRRRALLEAGEAVESGRLLRRISEYLHEADRRRALRERLATLEAEIAELERRRDVAIESPTPLLGKPWMICIWVLTAPFSWVAQAWLSLVGMDLAYDLISGMLPELFFLLGWLLLLVIALILTVPIAFAARRGLRKLIKLSRGWLWRYGDEGKSMQAGREERRSIRDELRQPMP